MGYHLSGQAENGSYVLHAVDRSGIVNLHELLLIRPVAESSGLSSAERDAVILGNARFTIEKFESIPVDEPYDASVAVEGNTIVVTIASP